MKAAADITGSHASDRRSPCEPAGRLAPVEVLVVDDDPNILKLFEVYFSRVTGVEATTCVDSREALRMVAKGDRFSLVITDFEMPHLDGAELAREITARRPGLPIMAYSSRAHDCPPELFDRVLSKPAGSREMLDAIGELLHLHLSLRP